MKIILSLACGIFFAVSNTFAATDLAGGWQGTWTRNGDALPVTVTFAKSGSSYSGSFDSDALQVTGIPFSDISDVDGKVHWLLKGDQSATDFEGTIKGDKIIGTLTDGSSKGPFVLERSQLTTSSVVSRDVTFQDKAVTLAGTLLLPATPGRHAAVLFLHGSGPEGRWANRYLAQKFAQNGIAALIYDKRGVGQSTGDWQKVGFDALADDAIPASDYCAAKRKLIPRTSASTGTVRAPPWRRWSRPAMAIWDS